MWVRRLSLLGLALIFLVVLADAGAGVAAFWDAFWQQIPPAQLQSAQGTLSLLLAAGMLLNLPLAARIWRGDLPPGAGPAATGLAAVPPPARAGLVAGFALIVYGFYDLLTYQFP